MAANLLLTLVKRTRGLVFISSSISSVLMTAVGKCSGLWRGSKVDLVFAPAPLLTIALLLVEAHHTVMIWLICGLFLLITIARGQQIGPVPEHHLRLTTQKCTKGQNCVSQKASIVLDAQWRDLLDIDTGDNCLTDDYTLNKTLCPTAQECAKNCALYGIDYKGTGVEAEENSVTLRMYKDGYAVEPQIYLLDEDGTEYSMLKLLNQEISFEVDVSNLPCGMNGAMYLAEMSPSGGRSHLNPAGASYGTGYCDSQCYTEYNFVNGVANIGHKHGACCNEMDLWESNSRANQVTAHPCNTTGFYACTGNECDGGKVGACGNYGCGFNAYGLGAHEFYGVKGTVDTRKPFRVITQFVTNDGTVHGTLAEIRRLYLQHGKLIHNANVKLNKRTYDSITVDFCKATIGHPGGSSFSLHGGLDHMGDALGRGMVLVMGIWNDPADYQNWLDAGDAGPCNKKEGKPSLIKKNYPDTRITFSDMRWGDIGTTYDH